MICPISWPNTPASSASLFTIAISPGMVARGLELERRCLKKAKSIDPAGLDAGERLTRELFLRGRRLALDGERFPGELLAVDQFQSMPVVFAMLGSGVVQPFETVSDYDNWLARMNGWTNWVDQAIVNLRLGVETGVVQPRIIVERSLPLLGKQIVSDPRKSPFFGPIRKLPRAIEKDQRTRLESAYVEKIRDEIIPAYRKLRDFLRDVYLPAARTSVGMWSCWTKTGTIGLRMATAF